MSTHKMLEIEKREGKNLKALLPELYETCGKQADVAARLGVSQGTISLWISRLGLKEKTILVPADYPGESQPAA